MCIRDSYKDDVEQKREEIFRRMDNLQGKIEACKCILDKRTESRLASILFRLKASGNLWHAEKEIRQILYPVSYTHLRRFILQVPVVEGQAYKRKAFYSGNQFPGRDMYGSVCDYPETVDTPDSAFAYRKF